ncbi:ureidoglycolate lyase [Phyllobacterium phragmitis]|uniref:Ureidoglycolate lyase n=1 Tax=Phyllobacterium phragmitis TaxID=2670329 RepID=A0ABQ0GXD4_9HYPH
MRVESLDVHPLTKQAFTPFGEVIETGGAEMRLINNGTTRRFHDLANIETTGEAARVLVNIFRGQAFAPPIDIVMLERHPLGSQAFMPLERRPFLVVVAEDEGGRPGLPQAFLAAGHQGVNYRRNVWHHPLLALAAPSEFLVVDRGGEGNNLEEFFFEGVVYRIEALLPAP